MHKLADIVTSLDSELVSCSRVIQCNTFMWKPFNNIISGINELYVCKYLLDLDLTLMNIWKDNYCLENDYNRKQS